LFLNFARYEDATRKEGAPFVCASRWIRGRNDLIHELADLSLILIDVN
jgi:hypothetical protein